MPWLINRNHFQYKLYTLEMQLLQHVLLPHQFIFVQLEVADTGSIEKFRGSIPTNYFRHIHAIILMYDVTNPSSLDDLEDWTTDAHHKTAGDSSITYTLIGNKVDRIQDETCLLRANVFGLKHEIPEKLQFKISAANNSEESLKEIFKTVASNIYATQTNRDPEEYYESGKSLIISEEHTDSGGKKCSKC